MCFHETNRHKVRFHILSYLISFFLFSMECPSVIKIPFVCADWIRVSNRKDGVSKLDLELLSVLLVLCTLEGVKMKDTLPRATEKHTPHVLWDPRHSSSPAAQRAIIYKRWLPSESVCLALPQETPQCHTPQTWHKTCFQKLYKKYSQNHLLNCYFCLVSSHSHS